MSLVSYCKYLEERRWQRQRHKQRKADYGATGWSRHHAFHFAIGVVKRNPESDITAIFIETY